jgi:hypothetical protein
VTWGERGGEEGVVNLDGRRFWEALTGEGRWRRGSGEVRRGSESSGCRRSVGGSRGCRGARAAGEEERKGKERNGARRTVARPFYTDAWRWGTVDEAAPRGR